MIEINRHSRLITSEYMEFTTPKSLFIIINYGIYTLNTNYKGKLRSHTEECTLTHRTTNSIKQPA